MTAHPLAPAAAGLLLASSLPAQATIVLQTLTDAVTAPMYAAATAADPAHLYIAERDGTVRRVDRTSGALEATPFLDIRSQVNTGGEGGLLGIAFDPAYASNGHFYVNYLDNSQQTRVVRYTAAGGVVDPGSAQTVIAIDQPQLNHNGGWIGFGPDHRLYVATGDGGGANDNFPGHTGGIGNAQDLSSPLGKILRLDVDSDAFPADPGRNYAIPTDNPLLGGSAPDHEVGLGIEALAGELIGRHPVAVDRALGQTADAERQIEVEVGGDAVATVETALVITRRQRPVFERARHQQPGLEEGRQTVLLEQDAAALRRDEQRELLAQALPGELHLLVAAAVVEHVPAADLQLARPGDHRRRRHRAALAHHLELGALVAGEIEHHRFVDLDIGRLGQQFLERLEPAHQLLEALVRDRRGLPRP